MLDTTYFFAASIVRRKGSIQSGILPSTPAETLPPSFDKSLGQKGGIGPVEVLDRVTMQLFVRDYCTMIAAPVQCDVDGIPKRSHCVSVPAMAEASSARLTI